MVQIIGKGHEILACFDIEYEGYIKDIADELMSHPDKKYKLTLERIPK